MHDQSTTRPHCGTAFLGEAQMLKVRDMVRRKATREGTEKAQGTQNNTVIMGIGR